MADYKKKYTDEVRPALVKEFNYTNEMQVPKVEKIVVNVGVGRESADNPKVLDFAVGDITTITGQKPVITKAKKSIANFKLREDRPIGVRVTLRGPRMYDFLDRLINLALPRVRDFRGVPADAFDGRGNYTLGLREQLIFPEIEYDKIDKVRGLEVTIVTTAKTDDEGRALLRLFGMPFVKPAGRQ
jgi:large subunit ribosomal protein L5